MTSRSELRRLAIQKGEPMPTFSKPKLLDLFCGAGGCSEGYHRAGFDVVGVDISPQPNYPFPFIQMDALVALETLDLSSFDAIHASPPCQAYSICLNFANSKRADEHPDLVAPTRELLKATGLPYVIENVMFAPLENPTMLCGEMFNLKIHRHRLFETSFFFLAPRHSGHLGKSGKMGYRPAGDEFVVPTGHFGGFDLAKEAMDIDWMDRQEITQAIPPAYTEFIGEQLLAHLGVKVG